MARRDDLPIVTRHTCLLSEDDLQGRIEQWRALTARALSRSDNAGVLTSVFPRDDDVADTLHALIDAEAACCSFLAFQVRERDDAIEVELRYPDGFNIESVFGRA